MGSLRTNLMCHHVSSSVSGLCRCPIYLGDHFVLIYFIFTQSCLMFFCWHKTILSNYRLTLNQMLTKKGSPQPRRPPFKRRLQYSTILSAVKRVLEQNGRPVFWPKYNLHLTPLVCNCSRPEGGDHLQLARRQEEEPRLLLPGVWVSQVRIARQAAARDGPRQGDN